MGRLVGRVALVTGGGGGIGAAIAVALAKEGADVVVNDLGSDVHGIGADASPGQRVAESIRALGGKVVVNGGDVSNFEDAQAMVTQAIDEFGKLDVLLNVAGILRDRMVFNMTESEWDDVIRVHMKGTFNTTRHASAYWRRERDPDANRRIINFTSGAGLHGSPGHANYAAAKLGIVGFTYSCANALGPYGVTANAVSPGAATRMTESVPDDRRRHPQDGDERAPENIAPAVAYLASEESGWCSGQVLSVRGYEVGLYSIPTVVRSIALSHRWSIDDAFRLMEPTFRQTVEATPNPRRVTVKRESQGPGV